MDLAVQQGWALRALAREAGVGVAVPNAWRSGRSTPRLHSALLVARVLRVRLDWVPLDPAEEVTLTDDRPSANWQTYRRSKAMRLILDPASDAVTYNAQLIGAELHWRRTQARVPLWEDNAVA